MSIAGRDSKSRDLRFFDKHPALSLALIAIIVFAALDIAIAKILIAADVYRPAHKQETYYRIRHSDFHHTLSPGVDDYTSMFGPLEYTISTNSLGFKDKAPRKIPLATSGPRILFIGDSFTEGVGVNYADTFVGIIDNKLASENIEVLNAAVSSYSPVIYRRKVEYLIDQGLQFDHLVVAIDISDVQNEFKHYKLAADNRVVDRDPPGIGEAVRDWLSGNTLFYANARILMRQFRQQKKANTLEAQQGIAINVGRAQWTYNDAVFSAWGREGLQISAQHMDALKSILRNAGIELTIFVYPWPDQIWNDDLDSRQVVFWRDWASRNNARFINLFPRFFDSSLQPRESILKYYLSGDYHWNAGGHALVAAALLEELELSGLKSD